MQAFLTLLTFLVYWAGVSVNGLIGQGLTSLVSHKDTTQTQTQAHVEQASIFESNIVVSCMQMMSWLGSHQC